MDQFLNALPTQLIGAVPWYVLLGAAIIAIWLVKKTVKKIMGIVFGLLSFVKLIHWLFVLYNMHS